MLLINIHYCYNNNNNNKYLQEYSNYSIQEERSTVRLQNLYKKTTTYNIQHTTYNNSNNNNNTHHTAI